uniref:Uncharacterized protein n=1 Tax=Arundo donax TaxID=35708 RepID=A0A0A8YYK1_ARUDO
MDINQAAVLASMHAIVSSRNEDVILLNCFRPQEPRRSLYDKA